MSKIQNVPHVDEEKVNINRSAIEHRATWMALIFDEATKADYDAEVITRKAIKRCGVIHGTGFKAACADPDDVSNFAEVFLTDIGKKTFEMEITGVDKNSLSIEFHYCPLVAAWEKLGLDDETCALLCDIAMDGDRGIAEAMGLKLDLTDTIAKGCPTCKLNFHNS